MDRTTVPKLIARDAREQDDPGVQTVFGELKSLDRRRPGLRESAQSPPGSRRDAANEDRPTAIATIRVSARGGPTGRAQVKTVKHRRRSGRANGNTEGHCRCAACKEKAVEECRRAIRAEWAEIITWAESVEAQRDRQTDRRGAVDKNVPAQPMTSIGSE